MFTLSTYHTTHGWLLKSGGWLAWLWLSLPLTILAQQPADSLMTKQTGVGVFGAALRIHADTIGVWGDVVLDSANVGGNGVLSLRGNSPDKSAETQRIIAQHSQVQHLHLASTGKTILLGDLRIEKSLTVEKGVFDISAGTLEQSVTCQTRLLKGGHLRNVPTWTLQSTDQKNRLENSERLVGLNTEETVSLSVNNAKSAHRIAYRLTNHQLIKLDNPAPPPKVSSAIL